MQTFLPSSDFTACAQMLDSKRLNKQILEGYQILNVLSGKSPTGGWRNHPAVLMWKGHEYYLHTYIAAMIYEAKLRGIKTDKNQENIENLETSCRQSWGVDSPSWLSDKKKIMRIITTHKANLFRKDPIYYANFQTALFSIYNTPCCPTCQYYWVTHEIQKKKTN